MRNVKLELEAKLGSTVGGFFSRPGGKVERKSYEDLTERLKITVRNLKVPDNSEAIVTADGEEIARVTVVKGNGRFDEETRDISAMPALQPGQTIEVSVDGVTLLKGDLYVD